MQIFIAANVSTLMVVAENTLYLHLRGDLGHME